MGGPWLSSCFIFIIIIQHNDAVSGGHGGSNPPEGGSVGDFKIPARKGWDLKKSSSSIAPSLPLTHFPIFLGFSNIQPNSVLSAYLQQPTVPCFLGALLDSPKSTTSLHPQLHHSHRYPVFQLRFPTISPSWQVYFSSQPRTTSHDALQISLTSPETGTTPLSAPPHVFFPLSLSNTINPHTPS